MKKDTFGGSNGNSPFISCLLLKTVGVEFIENWCISAQKSPDSVPKSCTTILSSSPTFFFQTAQPYVCRAMSCGRTTHRSHEGSLMGMKTVLPKADLMKLKEGPGMEGCWKMWLTHIWMEGGLCLVNGAGRQSHFPWPLSGRSLLLGAEVDLSQPD